MNNLDTLAEEARTYVTHFAYQERLTIAEAVYALVEAHMGGEPTPAEVRAYVGSRRELLIEILLTLKTKDEAL